MDVNGWEVALHFIWNSSDVDSSYKGRTKAVEGMHQAEVSKSLQQMNFALRVADLAMKTGRGKT